MTESTFTFRVDDALKAAFSEAAKAQDQTVAQLLRGFMRDFVKQQQNETEYDTWFRQQVEDGIAAANAGDVIPSEDIEKHFAARRVETRRKIISGR